MALVKTSKSHLPRTWFANLIGVITLLITLLTSFPLSLHAAVPNATVNDFKLNALILPRRLLADGYETVGDVSLSSLMQSFSQVEIHSVQRVAHPNGLHGTDALRDSAQWTRTADQGSIAINQSLWKGTRADVKPVLALHEALGALGYEDHIYSCSGALWLLANPSAVAALTPGELKSVSQAADTNCRHAAEVRGGSTGVTGGGDEFSIRVKIADIQDNLKKIGTTTDPQARQSEIDNIEGWLGGSDFFIDRYGAVKPPKQPQRISMPPYLLNSIPDISTIDVELDGKPVPQDAKNGWTYDASVNALFFHGKYNNFNYQSMAVNFTRQ